MLEEFEAALLFHQSSEGVSHPVLCQYLHGDYLSVLNSSEVRRCLHLDRVEVWTGWDASAVDSLRCQTSLSAEESKWLLVGGAAALSLFVRLNWTGPRLLSEKMDSFPFSIDPDTNQRCVDSLSVDGCDVYQHTDGLQFLFIGKMVFHVWQSRLSMFQSVLFWRLRYCHLYQAILDECCCQLFDVIQSCSVAATSDKFSSLLSSSMQLFAEWHLTLATVYTHYHRLSEARAAVEAVQHAANIHVKLIGTMGKRTYWQDACPQLALDVQTNSDTAQQTSDQANHKPTSMNYTEPCDCSKLPPDVVLTDDNRRSHIQYENSPSFPLSSLQQAVILNLCMLDCRSEGRCELRDEKLLVTLQSVLQSPRNWCIQLSALLQRSKLECDGSRTVERSMMQIQSLVDSVESAEPCHSERVRLFYCCPVPTRWQLESSLATLFMSLGVVKSALEIYERLHLWDEAIDCYHVLQQRQRAEQLVRRLIDESGETAKLLCMLGDATDDVTCYDRAWQLSDHTSVRAVRSQGMYYYFKKEYDRCIPLFQRCVELNCHQYRVWIRLAYAALQQENWEVCSAAYRRCCDLEPDNFEAWNNISKAYINMGQKDRAWRTLRESLKLNYNNSKIWQNFLVVSVDVGEFEEAINAYRRLVQIEERHVDVEVLRVLVSVVVDNTTDAHGEPSRRLYSKLSQLLHRLTSALSDNSELWCLRADLISAIDCGAEALSDVIRCYQRALRSAVLRAQWYQRQDGCISVLQLCVKLAESGLKLAKKRCDKNSVACTQTLASIRMSVHSTVLKVKSVHEMKSVQVDTDDESASLVKLVDSCSQLVQKLTETASQIQSSTAY